MGKYADIYLKGDAWNIIEEGFSAEHSEVSESIFSLANEFTGVRGFFDEGVVADFNNSITVDETINYKTNPSFTQDLLQFKTTVHDLNPNHRTTYKLNNILFSNKVYQI